MRRTPPRDDEKQQYGNNGAGNKRAYAEAVLKCHGNVIRARAGHQQRNAHGCKDGEQHGHDLSERLDRDAAFHVKIRAAAVLAIHTDFIDLAKAVLRVSDCRGYQRSDDHPEYSAGAAVHNRHHNAADVADSDTICGHRAEGFKRGYPFLRSSARCEEFPLQLRFGHITKLHKDAEQYRGAERQHNQWGRPQHIVDF